MPNQIEQMIQNSHSALENEQEAKEHYKAYQEADKKHNQLLRVIDKFMRQLGDVLEDRFFPRIRYYIYETYPDSIGAILHFNKTQYGKRLKSLTSRWVINRAMDLPRTLVTLVMKSNETQFIVSQNETPIDLGEQESIQERIKEYYKIHPQVITKINEQYPKINVNETITWVQQYLDLSYSRITAKSIKSYFFIYTSFNIGNLPSITDINDSNLIKNVETFISKVESLDSAIQRITQEVYQQTYYPGSMSGV
jgi:hypothetical protein